ncbi:hypothetical protein QOT17_022257 [Balamuthia mandrillaris]
MQYPKRPGLHLLLPLCTFSLIFGLLLLADPSQALRERSAQEGLLHPGLLPVRSGRQLGEERHHIPRHKPGYPPKFGGRNSYRQLSDALANETAMSDPFQSNYQLSKARNFLVVNRFDKCRDQECGEQDPAVELLLTEYRRLDGNNEARYELPALTEVYAVASPDFEGSLHSSLVVFYSSDTGCGNNAYVIFDTKHDNFANGEDPDQVKGCLGGVRPVFYVPPPSSLSLSSLCNRPTHFILCASYDSFHAQANERVRGVAWGNVNPTPFNELHKEELLVVTLTTGGTNAGRLTFKLFIRNENTGLLNVESSLFIDDVFAFDPNNKRGDVIAGDFDGDGLEEFAVLYFTAKDEAQVAILAVDDDMALVLDTSFTLDDFEGKDMKVFGQMTGGHLYSPDWEELAILLGVAGEENEDNGFYLYHLKLSESGQLEEGAPSNKLPEGAITRTGGHMGMDIGAGDFNGDTRDEIAFTFTNDASGSSFSWGAYLGVAVVEPTAIVVGDIHYDTFNGVIVDTSTDQFCSSLAIGRFSQQEESELDGIFQEHIAVMGQGNVALFSYLDGSLEQLTTSEPIPRTGGGQEPSTEQYSKEFMVGVYYATQNVRLGKPRHWKYPQVLNIVASLRAPPRHYDIVDGEVYAIHVNPPNNYGYISAKTVFETTESTGSRFSVQYKKSWFAGADLNVYLGKVTVGLTTTYGQNFENVNTEQFSETWSDVTVAVEDDALLRTEVMYDVWEYPVYSFNFTETEPTDYILVIWPERLPDGSEDRRIHSLGFKHPNSFVRPFNEVNNLFSYYNDVPPNLGRLLKATKANSYGGTRSLYQVSWEDIETNKELQSTSWSVGASFGLDVVVETSTGAQAFGNGAKTKGKWGFDLEVKGKYTSKEMVLSTMTVSSGMSIAIKLSGTSNGGSVAYTVYPYIFYDKNEGYLCVDYRVDLSAGEQQGTVTFWETVYNKPDLTWNMPYRWDMLNGRPSDNKYFTKSLVASNDNPEAGEQITVIFHARDYSLIPAANAVLRLFQGDFRNPANQFGEDVLLEEVFQNGAFGAINGTWREVEEPLDRCLYAWLDPDDEMEEVHEDNNVGYIILNTQLFSENELVFCGDIIKDTFGFEIPPDSLASSASSMLPFWRSSF